MKIKAKNKEISLFDCLYCQDNIKPHYLSETRDYFFCKSCKCHFIRQDNILVKIEIDTIINDKNYTVQLDLIKNKTLLICGYVILSFEQCLFISPTNINNKVKTWLMFK
jgi:hypothetical protein